MLIDAFMETIVSGQGVGENKEVDEGTLMASINVLRKLLDGAFSILKVHNPRHLKTTISMLALVDRSLKNLSEATSGFQPDKLSETSAKWLVKIRPLIWTIV